MIAGNETSLVFKMRGPLDPVGDSAICVPRPELGTLVRAANAPAIDSYFVVLGSRQTGKTTLLYQLRTRLRSRGFGLAFIDLSVVREQPEQDLYQFVATEIVSAVRSLLTRPLTTTPSAGAHSPADPSLPCNPIQFRSFLLQIAQTAQTSRLVILVDEIEAISEKHSAGFFGAIRNAFSSRRKEDEEAFEKYLFVFAGARDLHRLTGGPNSPMNIAERVYLQDLTLDGVRQIVSNFRRASIMAPEESARWVYDQTSGHPYLTQRLCSQIEQWHPGVVTLEIVQRAAVHILKTDDHLDKMLSQIDAEAPARRTLEGIVSGKKTPFTRLQPEIARLELLGAIREAGNNAVVRNPIYYAAFRTHFNIKPQAEKQKIRGKRLAIALIAFAFFLLNLPFMFNYTYDIYWLPRSVNDRFVTQALGADFLIHYDRVLLANGTDPSVISVDLEGSPTAGPVYITFLGDQDITLDGSKRISLDQPYQQARFKFRLNQIGLSVLRYNPFRPATDHRRVNLLFELASGASTRETYIADFLVDYYSAFVFSAVVTLASFIASLSAIFARMGHFQDLVGLVKRATGQEE